MSLNVPKEVLDASLAVHVTVDTNKLGPRQKKALQRMVITGVLKGHSLPVVIARRLRLEAGLPTLHLGRYRLMYWNLDHNFEFFEAVLKGTAAASLNHEAPKHGGRDWQAEEMTRCMQIYQERIGTGVLPYHTFEWDLRSVSLPRMEMPELPDTFVVDWKAVEADWSA